QREKLRWKTVRALALPQKREGERREREKLQRRSSSSHTLTQQGCRYSSRPEASGLTRCREPADAPWRAVREGEGSGRREGWLVGDGDPVGLLVVWASDGR